jgi:hypothetical protein
MSGVQYQSANFDISLTLPIKDGETVEKAIKRVTDTVYKSLTGSAEERMEQAYEQILLTMQQADEQKRSFDR